MFDSDDIDKKIQKEQQIYKRVSLLGQGSFGKAYLVKQIKNEKLWVIKQLNLYDMSNQEQEKAMKEAKILQVLDHPNIVKFKEVYKTSKKKLNIVMEYADGGDLSSKIKQAKETMRYFEESQILNWFTQICLGVKHIHDRKIIHRDIKGQNIFLTNENIVKIGDFGVATVLDKTIEKAKTVVGSPYYLSPQIIQNKPYSFKTDIWSLGALLFEICCLNPPFTANNLQFLALKIVKGSYSNIPLRYSLQLRTLIKSMLNTNATLRPNINQILCSKVLSNRIKKFLTESQKLHQFSHTVLHHKNVFQFHKDKLQNQQVKDQQIKHQQVKSQIIKKKLMPPPNLIKNQQMKIQQNNSKISIAINQSQIVIQNRSSRIIYESPKTHQQNVRKKPPTHFVNRPASGNRNQLQQERNDLKDLISIRPTYIQPVEKIKLPVVPSPFIAKKRYQTPNVSQNQIIKKKQSLDLPQKKQPVEEIIVRKKQTIPVQKNKRQLQIKGKSEILSRLLNKNQNNNNLNNEKQKEKEKQKQKKIIDHKIINAPKKSVNKSITNRKNVSKPQPNSSKAKQQKIQIASNQFKKKAIQNQKKIVKKSKIIKGRPKLPKKQQIFSQIMEQQKTNIEQTQQQIYQNDDFEHYQDDQQKKDQLLNQSDFQIQLSLSQSLQPKNKQTYQKILLQMKQIQDCIEKANGVVANLPLIGSQLPQIFMLSAQIRQDDNEFDNTNVNFKKIEEIAQNLSSQSSLPKNTQNLNIAYFSDHSQIQNLRMTLQEIFGLDNIIHAYKIIEDQIRRNNLDFKEEQLIRKILKSRLQIDQVLLRKYFRLIVTVIAMQNQILCSDESIQQQ